MIHEAKTHSTFIFSHSNVSLSMFMYSGRFMGQGRCGPRYYDGSQPLSVSPVRAVLLTIFFDRAKLQVMSVQIPQAQVL